jgi:hypothetical protein
MNVDANGLAWVWDLANDCWVKRQPVDARECIAAGEFAIAPPKDSKALPPGFTENGPPVKEEQEQKFGAMSKPALRKLCDLHGVPYVGQDSKATLVAKLVACGVPSDVTPEFDDPTEMSTARGDD